MFSRIIIAIKNQNRWYDALDKHDPVLRFMLFILPFMLAILVDTLLMLLGVSHNSIVFYCTILIMAVWRLIGFIR